MVPKMVGTVCTGILQTRRGFGIAARGYGTLYRDKTRMSLCRAFEKQIRDLGCCYERCLLRSVVHEKALSEHTLPERTALTDRFATSLRPNRLFVGRYEDLSIGSLLTSRRAALRTSAKGLLGNGPGSPQGKPNTRDLDRNAPGRRSGRRPAHHQHCDDHKRGDGDKTPGRMAAGVPSKLCPAQPSYSVL